jgi:hypothetical protein
MGNAIEKYYTVSAVALLLDFSTKWVTEQLLAGQFGKCIRLGSGRTADYRIPASGINGWIARNSIGLDAHAPVEPIAAQNQGQLRRKAGNGHFAEVAR